MAKKLVVGVVGAVLLGVFLFGTRFFGYMGTMVDSTRQSIQDNVPFELELAELKKLVAGFDKDINKLNKEIVRLEVEVENMDELIAQKEGHLKQQESEMVTLLNGLGDGTTEFVAIGENEYPASEVRADLVRREKIYDSGMAELEQKKRARDSHSKNLKNLNERKNQMKSEKAEYEAAIAELAATKSALEAQETAETVTEFDDTRQTRARELKQKLQNRLRMEQKLIEKRQESSEGNIPIKVETETEVNVQERLRNKFKGVKPADHELISIER